MTLAVDGLAGLTGGLISERALERYTISLVGFAAGALLAAAFLDTLPEAFVRMGASASRWAFLGFVAAALLEWWLGTHHHHDRVTQPTLPMVLLASDALHNVVDGAAIAAAWLLSPRAGLTTAIAVIAHEVPQEIGDFAVLRRFGYSRPRALAALFVVQLTAVAGALGIALATNVTARVADRVIALASGSFLYIGATDLLPALRAEAVAGARWQRSIGFLAGILTIVAAGLYG